MKRYIIKVRDLKQIISEVVNNNFNLKESNADELFKLSKDQIPLYLFKNPQGVNQYLDPQLI